MKAPTDEMLLHDYMQGDSASFELLVRRHATELFRFARRLTGNASAAADVVQETFFQIHISADRFDLSRRFKPWLFTIAANKSRDFLRKRERKREVPLDAQIGGDEDTGCRFVDLLAADYEAPHKALIVEERRRLVKDVVGTMPAKLSAVLILAYYHRFAYKDIAEITGIPLGTVKSRLHAAVAQFGVRYRLAVEEQVRGKL